jgi:hypothetical protein
LPQPERSGIFIAKDAAMQEINTILLLLSMSLLIAVELRFPPSRRGRWLLAGGYLAAVATLNLVTIRAPLSADIEFALATGACILLGIMSVLLMSGVRPDRKPQP